MGCTLNCASLGEADDLDRHVAGHDADHVADAESGIGVHVARDRLAVALGEPALDQGGGLSGPAEHEAEDRRVDELALADVGGERPLSERLRPGHAVDLGDRVHLVRRHDASLDGSSGVGVEDEDLGRLVLEPVR